MLRSRARLRHELVFLAIASAAISLAPVACQMTPSGVKSSMFAQYANLEEGTAEVTEAAEAVLNDLGLHEVDAQSTYVDGWAKGLMADGTPVNIRITRVGENENLSEIFIRAGTFGDSSLGQDIIARVRDKLGIEQPPPTSDQQQQHESAAMATTSADATTPSAAPPEIAPATRPHVPGEARIVAAKNETPPGGRWTLVEERARQIQGGGKRCDLPAGEPSREWIVFGHSPAGWWDEERQDWVLVWKNDNPGSPPDPATGICDGVVWHWAWSKDFNDWIFSYACDEHGTPGHENGSFFAR